MLKVQADRASTNTTALATDKAALAADRTKLAAAANCLNTTLTQLKTDAQPVLAADQLALKNGTTQLGVDRKAVFGSVLPTSAVSGLKGMRAR